MALAGAAIGAFVNEEDHGKGASTQNRRDTQHSVCSAACDISQNVQMEQGTGITSRR